MEISRKLGILVVCGVPAIVGGGLIYAIFGGWVSVFVFEGALALAAGGVIAK